jgi:hypothetical protein
MIPRNTTQLTEVPALVLLGKVAPVEVRSGVPEQLQIQSVEETDQKAEFLKGCCRGGHLVPILSGGCLAVEAPSEHQVIATLEKQLNL